MPKVINNSYNSVSAGQPIRPEADLDFLQLSAANNVGYIIENLIGSGYDNTKSYILRGCVSSSSGGTTTVTAGLIYGKSFAIGSLAAASHIYFVPAVTFADPVGPDVVLCNISQIADATWDPTPFTDGTPRSIHIDYQLQFSAGASGSGFANYADLLKLKPSEVTVTSAGAGYSTSSLAYRKDFISRTVRLIGFVTNPAPSPAGLLLATLPAEARPSDDERHTVTFYDGVSVYSCINVIILSSTGTISLVQSADLPVNASSAIFLSGITLMQG